ncbi:hypothetical protein JM946_17205 [Steroidobacter sp. S1-65]|uniref:Uncharacterized protein n=1 Tax=Steroidobacter gossypii TaxID=2805490 RepID=A0ABS1WZT0_9GAMM|nr:hypothetical protein [Steroidobacter gossypii]
MASLSPERRAKIAARTAALIAQEKSSSELRRARALTQTKQALPKRLASARSVFPSSKAAPI